MHNQSHESHKITCEALAELGHVAREIIDFAGEQTLWLFEGQMGAGKTTLIRQICEELRVVDNVSSPTFSLVNEYQSETGETLYHFDFYRINKEQEALDIGVEEYFDSGDICLIEWPSKIASLLPETVLQITIHPGEGEQRTFHLTIGEYDG